jgi:transcriptional regulator with XRE-family HTH domain
MDKPRPEFTAWLRERVDHEGGLRASAQKANVSHATLLRGLNGEALSLRTLEGISNWTGVSLVRLLNLYSGELEDSKQLEDTLARVLDEHPELKETLLASLQVLDDEAVAEVIEYINFQTQRRNK